MDQSAHPSIHPSTKITKTIGVIRSYVVWTFSIVTVQKLPQLPTLPKYHTIFLNKHHGTYRATTGKIMTKVLMRNGEKANQERRGGFWKNLVSTSVVARESGSGHSKHPEIR